MNSPQYYDGGFADFAYHQNQEAYGDPLGVPRNYRDEEQEEGEEN